MNQEFACPLVQSQRWKLWLGAVAIGVVASAYVMPERVAELVSLQPVTLELVATAVCRRRLKFEPPCRLKFEPGLEAGREAASCG
jgi:hypothetical protein